MESKDELESMFFLSLAANAILILYILSGYLN